MGLFLCKCCNAQMGIEIHVCDPVEVEKHVFSLKERARIAERNLDDVRNAVYKLLQEIPLEYVPLESCVVPIGTMWLRDLWKAADCQWYQSKDADSFLICWMSMHDILRKAFDVFRSVSNGKKLSALEKLAALREACDRAKEVLGYQKSELDMTPNEVVKRG